MSKWSHSRKASDMRIQYTRYLLRFSWSLFYASCNGACVMRGRLRMTGLVQRFRGSNHIRRHSGAPPKARLRASATRYGGEPGIHNHRLGVWIPGSRPWAAPRNDQLIGCDGFHGIAVLVMALLSAGSSALLALPGAAGRGFRSRHRRNGSIGQGRCWNNFPQSGRRPRAPLPTRL